MTNHEGVAARSRDVMSTKDVVWCVVVACLTVGIWSHSQAQYLPTGLDCSFDATGTGLWSQGTLGRELAVRGIDTFDHGSLVTYGSDGVLSGPRIHTAQQWVAGTASGFPLGAYGPLLDTSDFYAPFDFGITDPFDVILLPYPSVPSDLEPSIEQGFNCIGIHGSSTNWVFEDSCPTCNIIGDDHARLVGVLQVSTGDSVLGVRWLGEDASTGSSVDGLTEGLQTLLDATVLLVTKIRVSTQTKFFPCTGTVFASGAILTAGHCMSWNADGEHFCGNSAKVEQIVAIGADAIPFSVEVPESLPCLPASQDFLLLDIELDHASPLILEWVASVGLPASAARSPVPDQLLISIQYRYDIEQSDSSSKLFIMNRMIQTDECAVNLVFSTSSHFFHHCDTSGGSSGSLLFDQTDLAIVGMHVAGHSSRLNRGIDVREIKSSLAPESSKLFR